MASDRGSEDQLARFVDRWTVRFDRTVAAPTDDVWGAVTTGSRLDQWMMPSCTVDRRAGGQVAFTFGDPARAPIRGTVAEWAPPAVVEYRFDNGMRLRFELTPVPAGTHVVMVHGFPVGAGATPVPDDPGGDVPGGPGTPWQPGFLAGYHLCLDSLAPHVAGTGTSAKQAQAAVDDFNAGVHDPRWLDLVDRYRDLIRTALPGT